MGSLKDKKTDKQNDKETYKSDAISFTEYGEAKFPKGKLNLMKIEHNVRGIIIDIIDIFEGGWMLAILNEYVCDLVDNDETFVIKRIFQTLDIYIILIRWFRKFC